MKAGRDSDPAPQENPPEPERKKTGVLKRWFRRIAIIAVGFITFVLLLVASLPTLISIAPIESYTSRTVSDLFEGEFEIQGLSLGWFTPFKIEKIRLYKGEKGDDFLRLDQLEINRSLSQMAFTENRVGEISIAELYVHLKRSQNGAFNFEYFIPPTDPDAPAPPPDPSDPFKLDLNQLIPKFPVPIPEAAFRIGQINVRFNDQSTTVPMNAALDNGAFSIHWPGEEAPITIDFSGLARGDGGTRTIKSTTTIEDWISGGTTTFGSLKLSSQLTLEDSNALDLNAQLANGSLEHNGELNLQPWEELALVLMPDLPIPETEGSLSYNLSLKPEDNHQRVDFQLDLESIAVTGAPGLEQRVDAPAITIKAAARLHQSTFERDFAELSVASDFLTFRVTESPSQNTGAFDVVANASLDTAPLIGHIDGMDLLPPLTPMVDSRAVLKIHATHNNGLPVRANIQADWEPETLTLPEALEFPEDYRPLDLQIAGDRLSVFTSSTIHAESTNSANVDFVLSNSFLQFDMQGRYTGGPASMEFGTSFKAGEISQWLATEFFTSPTIHIEGVAALSGSVDYDEKAEFSLSANYPDFAFETSMFPDFRIDDELLLEIDGDFSPETTATYVNGRFEDTYVQTRWDAKWDSEKIIQARLSISAALDPLRDDLVAYFVGELPVDYQGNLDVDIEVAQPDNESYQTSLHLKNGEGFRLTDQITGFEIEDIAAEVSAHAELENIIRLELQKAGLSLSEMLQAETKGDFTYDQESLTFQTTQSATLSYMPLFEQLSPWIEEQFAILLEAEGTSNYSSSLDGIIRLSPEINFPAPVKMKGEITTTIDYLAAETTEIGAELEALSHNIGFDLEVDPFAPAEAKANLSEQFSNGLLVVGDIAALEGISWTWELDYSGLNSITFSLNEALLEYIEAQAAGYTMAFEGLHTSVTFFANLEDNLYRYENLSAGLSDLAEVRSVAGKVSLDPISFELAASWDMPVLGALLESVSPDPLDGIATDFDGAVSGSLEASGRINAETSLPENLQTDFQTSYTRIQIRLPEMVSIDNAEGSISLNSKINLYNFKTTNRIPIEPLIETGITEFGDFQLEADSQFDLTNWNLQITDSRASLPGLGVDLSANGQVSNLDFFQDNLPENYTADEIVTMIVAVPYQFETDWTQSFNSLSRTPWLDNSEGLTRLRAKIINQPDQGLTIEFENAVEELSLDAMEMIKLRGGDGEAEVLTLYRQPGNEAPPVQPRPGGIRFEEFEFVYAPYRFPIEDAKFNLTSSPSAYQMEFIAGGFLGGPLYASGALTKQGDSPSLSLESSWTDIDAAYLLPYLSSYNREKRLLNIHAQSNWTIPSSPNRQNFFEDFNLDATISKLGPDILRGAIRDFSESGNYPGMQSAITALSFSRPDTASLYIRNGLMDSAVTMISPGTGAYEIPLLEKVNMVNLLGVYGPSDIDGQLSLARHFLDLILAQEIEELKSIAMELSQ